MGRGCANGPGDLGSIPGHVIPKTLKRYLIPPCLTLSNVRYVSRVKWSNSGKRVAPSTTTQCCNYGKRSLLVAFDYGRHLYFLLYYIYIYIYIYHHHHHVMPSTRIFLTLLRHPSVFSFASSRSSMLNAVATQSCRTQVLAGCPTFARSL